MTKLTTKEKMLKFLSKNSKNNTFTTAQARSMFGVTNIAARIHELREQGHKISTAQKTLRNGRKITYYILGKENTKEVSDSRVLQSQSANTFA